MLTRIWPLLVSAFSVLLGLGLVLGLVSIRQANETYQETLAIHSSFQSTEDVLHALRKEIFVSSILLRDLFLDSSVERASEHRGQLRESRERVSRQLADLSNSIPPPGTPLDRLQSKIESYWDSVEPVFVWDQAEKTERAGRFLREEVLSRRQGVLDIAEQIQSLNKVNFNSELERIRSRHQEFERYQLNVLILGFGIGLMVSAGSSFLVVRADRRMREQQRQTVRAEQELRKLSQRLVHVQEEERRAISRELHDQVGQMLTGLRMEMRNLERRRDGPREDFDKYLEETKKLIEETLQCVRHMAMGLRPSMLDDLGLRPALEWQVRDFGRRSGIPVSLKIGAGIADLADNESTCVYRVVQEALTNCGKHASATRVAVHVLRNGNTLQVVVADNGCGFEVDPNEGAGLGLLGMRERAHELGGTMKIESYPREGTTITVRIPVAM